MRRALPVLLLIGLSLPFLGKPVHIDEANFLAMAQQAAHDLWRPHGFSINWQGTTEPAFDVLSNPPGIAWWLAPLSDAPVWMQRLWMLPWLVLAAMGAGRLGQMLCGQRGAAILLLCGAPAALLASHTLTPDLPLLGCTLAGMAGILRPISSAGARARWPWALLLGLGACFRYSGLALIPLAALWPWLHRDRRGAVSLAAVAAVPTLVLALHDGLAYGQIHLLAMTGFQGVANTPWDLLHKLAASTAMLGGALVLPILCWTSGRRAIAGAAIGAGLGCTMVSMTGQAGGGAVGTLLFCAAGGATLGGALRRRDATDTLLLAWLGFGLILLVGLRFAAARYWLPFFAPAVLIPLRSASSRWIRAAVVVTPLLGLWLAVDDLELARAQETAAARAMTHGTGLIAGHWGFQHHLERAGWRPLEDDAIIAPGTLLATSAIAWPQEPAETCWNLLEKVDLEDRWPGPRVLTGAGRANLHGHSLAGDPPIPTFAPWGVASDPLDTLSVRQACDGDPAQSRQLPATPEQADQVLKPQPQEASPPQLGREQGREHHADEQPGQNDDEGGADTAVGH